MTRGVLSIAGLTAAALAACVPPGAPEGGLIRGTVVESRSVTEDGRGGDGSDAGTPLRRADAGFVDAGYSGCVAPTLEALRAELLVPRCGRAECHVGPDAPESLDLTLPLAELRTRLGQAANQSPSGLPLIRGGERGGSYLFLKVFLARPLTGERMPPDAPLDDCELDALAAWIDAGATD